ncbi:hypothetical protein NE237_030800 [Protea cynaroides]|uniref:Uncharacterized protein n=1 Tax=Protea cynaroides TaxID=273540 RepID=A0A9Q0GUE6_9MAGN|nr:hypothetical protein NE237_030800 [Protea cynaroides]
MLTHLDKLLTHLNHLSHVEDAVAERRRMPLEVMSELKAAMHDFTPGSLTDWRLISTEVEGLLEIEIQLLSGGNSSKFTEKQGSRFSGSPKMKSSSWGTTMGKEEGISHGGAETSGNKSEVEGRVTASRASTTSTDLAIENLASFFLLHILLQEPNLLCVTFSLLGNPDFIVKWELR